MTYAGAVGRMEIGDVFRLGSGYVCQPKIDGIYAEVETDERGIVVDVRSRSGRTVGAPARDIVGAQIASCAGVFVGELEAYTEAGRGAARVRGFAQVHLFDALRVAETDFAGAGVRAPYRLRRDALLRAQSAIATPEHLDGKRRHGERLWRLRDGTYSRGPRDWRVAPVVPSLPVVRAAELWDQVMSDLLEGLVVVAQAAPLGARRAKRKVKRADHLDCVVLEATGRRAVVRTFGRVFSVGCKGLDLTVGDVVEVAHNGWYERGGLPKFPRIVRRRDDARGGRPARLSSAAQAGGDAG